MSDQSGVRAAGDGNVDLVLNQAYLKVVRRLVGGQYQLVRVPGFPVPPPGISLEGRRGPESWHWSDELVTSMFNIFLELLDRCWENQVKNGL